ncbi:MAG: DUF1858 domain-containing protein [Bacteroidales bacterium]
MEKLIITPKTKIYDLLEAYPELEEVLTDAAPEFRKLSNPVLRKTITRITSIAQAAVIGKLNVEKLVNLLRAKAGQDSIDKIDEEGAKYNTVKPGWFSETMISNEINIGEMLNKGDQPVHEVMSAVGGLSENEILKIDAPFIPAPLIDKTLSMGYSHWIDENEKGGYFVYVKK